MSDYEISQLTSLSSPASGDLLSAVDVSDTTTPPAGSAGSNKKLTLSGLLAWIQANFSFAGLTSLATTHNTLDDGSGNASFAGEVKLPAGTASLTPLLYQSGTLNTAPAAGASEYDGTCFYDTAAGSSRQVRDTEQFTCLSSSYTLSNSTSAQKLFNATSNGALTVEGSTAYQFEAEFDVTGLSSSSHTIEFGFGGTATFTSVKYMVDSNTGAAGTLAAWQNLIVTAPTATAITAAATTTTLQVFIRGVMRINAGGTIIPQITQETAAAAAVVSANSWFRIWPVGSNTVTSAGDWS